MRPATIGDSVVKYNQILSQVLRGGDKCASLGEHIERENSDYHVRGLPLEFPDVDFTINDSLTDLHDDATRGSPRRLTTLIQRWILTCRELGISRECLRL